MAFTISEETSVNRLVRPKKRTLLLIRTDRPRRGAEACESPTIRGESRTVGYTGVRSVGAARAFVPLRSAHVGSPLRRARVACTWARSRLMQHGFESRWATSSISFTFFAPCFRTIGMFLEHGPGACSD